MIRYLIISFFAFSLVASGSAEAKKKPQMTPMELQAIQSKEFETTKENLFSAVMTVTQDLGYQVESADLQTGFITSSSPTENKTGFFEAFGGMQSSGNTKMTAYIQRMPNGMAKVRLNFLNSKNTSSAYGRTSSQDKPILDPLVYNNAWDKIDEALFVLTALDEEVSAKSIKEPVLQSDPPSEETGPQHETKGGNDGG